LTSILVVDDEPLITAFVEKGLRASGYATTAVHDGASALHILETTAIDLVVLDIGLPDRTGLEVLEELRGRGDDVAVILLTARNEVESTVAGFEHGADDYMTKPFRFEELLVRVRARLRSLDAGASTARIERGGVVVDLLTHRVRTGGQEYDLSTTEFRLLETLMRNAGQILTRPQLLDRVWGFDYDGGSNVVEVYVGYLRRKLGRSSIETVRGSGYRYVG
jgi:two-component system, OmpR family, response regulator QseB